jgi:3-methyladenine DNA glycosylase AlkC
MAKESNQDPVDPKQTELLESLRNRPAARRRSDVPPIVRNALNQGWIEARNLVEWLCVDRIELLMNLSKEHRWNLDFAHNLNPNSLAKLSKIQQSKQIAKSLAELFHATSPEIQLLLTHPSDVAREWGALIIGLWHDMPFPRRLAWIKPLADHDNAGTREFAWMALRHLVAENPIQTIEKLVPWTGSRSERLRRFASEITRPRGVWCPHIQLLKDSPEIALPILEPLLADSSLYVRNSVANWLNDASKSQPQWVLDLTNQWLYSSPTPETKYIVRRALRTLNKAADQ